MAQPQQYERTVDFTERDGDETNHAGINAELDAAALSVNQIRDSLALLQKDDGSLQNGIVTAESLAPSAFDAVLGSVAQATQEAQSSAQSALMSAITAGNSATAASNSAASVLASQNASALNSASAANSAIAAAASQVASAASQAAAGVSAGAASTSETNALASANAAAGSAATATTKAGEALTSANNASASEISADASMDAALVAKTAAEAALDSFDDRYLGAKAVAPTLDNDGNALLVGALYWDTVLPAMRSWAGASWSTLPAATAAATANTPAGNIAATTVQAAINELDSDKAAAGANTDITSLSGLTASIPTMYGGFFKTDTSTVAFTKLTAGTAEIKAGTIVDVAGTIVTFATATAITMPTLTAGTDYSIWATPAGALQAVADPYSAPAAAPVAGARKIGGFHYGLVTAGTTVAGGSFATTGNGMIWTQTNVDAIAGINAFSFWDLKWRCAGEQRGMAFDPYVRCWAAIYWCNSNHIANGISAYNTDVASGTVLPRIPLAYGGNGTAAYTNGNWWTFGEVAASFGLRMPTEREFVSAAYGVTENQSLGGASSTIPSTARQAGYTSRIGLEQTTGHIYTWGADSSTRWDGAGTPWNNRDVNGGRGQLYLYGDSNLVRIQLGGSRNAAALSGSRSASWGGFPWDTNWAIGLRAFGDHLMLA